MFGRFRKHNKQNRFTDYTLPLPTTGRESHFIDVLLSDITSRGKVELIRNKSKKVLKKKK